MVNRFTQNTHMCFDISDENVNKFKNYLLETKYFLNALMETYNIKLTEKDGLDRHIINFLNYPCEDILRIKKDNFYEYIADIFGFNIEDISYRSLEYNAECGELYYKDNPFFGLSADIYPFCNINLNSNYRECIYKTKTPKFLSGSIILNHEDVKEFVLPQIVTDGLYLNSETNVEGVVFPVICGHLGMLNVRKAANAVLPKIIIGDFIIDSVESAVSVTWPQLVIGNCYMGKLTSAEGLILPNRIIDGELEIGVITDDYLKLPEYVDGAVLLPDLVVAKNLVLPLKARTVEMEKLESAEGLVIPNPLTYNIKCKDFVITPDNVHLYRNKQRVIKYSPII